MQSVTSQQHRAAAVPQHPEFLTDCQQMYSHVARHRVCRDYTKTPKIPRGTVLSVKLSVAQLTKK